MLKLRFLEKNIVLGRSWRTAPLVSGFLSVKRPHLEEEPLRSELLSIDQLAKHAEEAARQDTVGVCRSADRLLPRLAENARVLRESQAVVSAASSQGRRLAPAAEWLLDNFYLIEQQIRLARLHLPSTYSRRLPRLMSGPMAGFPRVYHMAVDLISHLDGRLDAENTMGFVRAYQTVTPLKLGELWAFPITLRLGLIENLRRVSARITYRRLERDDGIAWAERMLATASTEPKHLLQELAAFADEHPSLSAPFLEEFCGRLRGQGATVAFVLNWVEHALAEENQTESQLLQADSHAQAEEQISIANSIGSLRFLGAMDWKEFVETLSVVDQTLRDDPASAYASQDFETRDRYRHVIEDIAVHSRQDEVFVAHAALDLALEATPFGSIPTRASHVGYYLVDRGLAQLRRKVGCRWSPRKAFCERCQCGALPLYLGAIFLGTAALTASVLPWFGSLETNEPLFWLLLLAAILVSSALSVTLVNFLVTLLVPPRPLARLDYSKSIPLDHKTLVVVPCLMQDQAGLSGLLESLEIHYLGNRDPHLCFALMTDFVDADEETLPGDQDLLRFAREGVESLNTRHGGESVRPPFYLFHRPRVWNAYEHRWMGYERKRGKLEQLNALLRGGPAAAFSDIVGDLAILTSIKFVITLDADTKLPRGAAHRLIGTLAHPLNRPRFDATRGRVVEGYAILQPRASIQLASATRSRFARLFAGEVGIDPYTREVSDVYQDLFSEGSYVGKGIYDVDAFQQALDGRFPDNLILSHDLLESGFARSALVSGVEVFENFPSSYLEDISRQHRWVRGDWQIAHWLFPRPPVGNHARGPNPLSALTHWKIFDNMRRSLFAPALLTWLVVGWWLSPLSPVAVTLFAVAILFLSGILRSMTHFLRKPRECRWRLHLRATGHMIGTNLAGPFLALVFLPYEALIMVDAIFQSAVRMCFTRRGLLIWHLRQYRRRNARHSLAGFAAEMWPAPLFAVVASLWLLQTPADSSVASLPLLVLWLCSPLVAWWISRPLQTAAPELSKEQWWMLRILSRRTWRYFEEFVGESENWLPPDNVQETPSRQIASRTSPTNIGLALLANLSALDFGYISTRKMLNRTEHMLSALDRLERYQGHFYNWYDTRTMLPLNPQYVSSVDSGNLLGAFIALHVGLRELSRQPVLSPTFQRGLQDTLALLREETKLRGAPNLQQILHDTDALLVAPPASCVEARSILTKLRALALTLQAAVSASEQNVKDWAQAVVEQCDDHFEDMEFILSLENAARPVPTLAELANPDNGWPVNDRHHAIARIQELERLASRCEEFETIMDFRFLYHASRRLLSIGFDVTARRLDPGCYDLLASESRLASFLIVSSEQVSPDHWFALGRLLTGYDGAPTLVSWSGSMFEYLMPALLMAHYPNTLLEQTCRGVIARQIHYGRQQNIPWGISESCYNARDAHHVYQYRAFGVPGLGLQRGLSGDLVVAPYATVLSLIFEPHEACKNLQRLVTREEALGTFGMYEAVDYTPSRVPRGKSRAVVHSFMTHHQGMSLVALSHVLLQAPMVRRFMAEPAVRATELLLQERVPQTAPMPIPHEHEMRSSAELTAVDAASLMRIFPNPYTPSPEVHLLSNGNYHVMVTHTGGGYSRWRNLDVTRWHEDATCDAWGAFVYVRDVDTANIWSVAFQPIRQSSEHYEAIFTQGRTEFRRRDNQIESHTEICVSPEDDVEVRRITLSNLSRQSRQLEVTSFSEVVLAPHNTDLAHPAFNKLFVETEILPDRQAILCSRRKRTPSDPTPWMFHLLVVPGAPDLPSFETDRVRFIGRGRTAATPAAMDGSAGRSVTLGNHEGAVLDPVVAIRQSISIPADSAVGVHVITGMAETREGALALVDKYRDRHFVDRAFDMSWTHSQIVLKSLNVTEAETQVYGRLAGSMLYAHAGHRATPSLIAQNRLGQQGLWRFGISGDLPIMLLRIGNLERMDWVVDALRAHVYWRMKGLSTDLVIVNDDYSGYRATLNDQIMAHIATGPDAEWIDKPGGVFVRRIESLSDEDVILLQTVARVILTDTAETLQEQVDRRLVPRRLPPPLRATQKEAPTDPVAPLPVRDLIFANGQGGFTPDGREYLISLEKGDATPAPWCNVIASPYIGTVVSESGGMYTWVDNAHEYRITPWNNDPVTDCSGEAFYLRDEDTGRFWSLMARPAPGRTGYVCRHGFGYSVFEHDEEGISTEAWVYVAIDAPVKFCVVKVRNHSGRTRRLSALGFFELVLGEWRHSNLMHIVTEKDPQTGAIFARNAYSREFSDRVVFAGCSEPDISVTGSRAEFIGRNGSLASPAALRRSRLSNATGAGFDPGAGLQAPMVLDDGQTREIVFTLGAGRSTDEAHACLGRFRGSAGARTALEAVWAHWNHTLGAVYVETPENDMNVLLNGWLPYQILSCRIWGRSGYYQSGGAYGFRDQLQDAASLIHTTPWILREQLLRCASHQFKEGDVQHWWHPPGGAGVRTHFSDDYLWLPNIAARYLKATGDTGILDEMSPFLEGRPVGAQEEAYYETQMHSAEQGTLYEHCVRGLRHALRFGAHGLPLIGCGDWNDGMNRIGAEGKGESVWLAWFLFDTLMQFAEVAHLRNDAAFELVCKNEAEALRARTEAAAWDGAWYLRAFYDDGTPLGSAAADECRIDSLSQSWAVLSGAATPLRASQAMQSMQKHLVKSDDGLVLLFTPPFDKTPHDPGYIKGYPPGMRENGGQYTHGAVWSVMAIAQLGDYEKAWELFRMLNPIRHSDTPEGAQRYKVEPYVMSADVYSAPPHVGRGGWTWYTGSAAWMYRLALETLLGLEWHNDYLTLTPRLPTAGWESYRIHYRYRDTFYHIEVNQEKTPADRKASVLVDEVEQPDGHIPLHDDHQDHFVKVYRI